MVTQLLDLPLLRHNASSHVGLVPSICLKPYTGEVEDNEEGLGTMAPPPYTPSIILDSLAEVDEQEEECVAGEGVAGEGAMGEDVVVEEGVGAEDGIVMEGCYMAVAKSFTARRPDELDVKEGDVVCILDDAQAGNVGREI